jgi:hypothetical protein
MTLPDIFDQLPTSVGGARVYGEAYETSTGATVIPVARIRGKDADGRGVRGSTAAPVGVFVIHGSVVSWKPAVDENRIALLAVITGLASAVIATLAVFRRPPWPDIRITRQLPPPFRRP